MHTSEVYLEEREVCAQREERRAVILLEVDGGQAGEGEGLEGVGEVRAQGDQCVEDGREVVPDAVELSFAGRDLAKADGEGLEHWELVQARQGM